MAMYRMLLQVEGSRLDAMQRKAQAVFGEDLRSVQKVDLAKSRQDRLNEIGAALESCASDIEELKDELQEWYDNLPEQFQEGDKGSELEEAIASLEELKDNIEGLDITSVSFPTMY